MAKRQGSTTKGREPLTREAVLRAAIRVADEAGIEALTMRRLGQELGVEAMSLYNHVGNKEDILDGIVDFVIDEIQVPPAGTPWREAMRARAISAHEMLLAHRWSPGLLTSRYNIGPANTRYLNETLGRLREGGFSVTGALDAWNTLDSHLYGFTLLELNLPFDADEAPDVSAEFLPRLAVDEFPYVTEVLHEVITSGRIEDFTFGLDLVLDGLESALERGRVGSS